MHIVNFVQRMSFFCLPKFCQFSSKSAFDYLDNVEYNNTVPFTPQLNYVKVIKVYDGDTITVASNMISKTPVYRFSVRLKGIDSPEIKTKNEAEKIAAIESRDQLHNLIYGKIVLLTNVSTEKYGRVLADVHFGSTHVNDWMLRHKLAVSYDGGTKKNFTEWEL